MTRRALILKTLGIRSWRRRAALESSSGSDCYQYLIYDSQGNPKGLLMAVKGSQAKAEGELLAGICKAIPSRVKAITENKVFEGDRIKVVLKLGVVVDGGSGQHFQTHSLQDMIENPSLKREVWEVTKQAVQCIHDEDENRKT